jgi:hypothetical protein
MRIATQFIFLASFWQSLLPEVSKVLAIPLKSVAQHLTCIKIPAYPALHSGGHISRVPSKIAQNPPIF